MKDYCIYLNEGETLTSESLSNFFNLTKELNNETGVYIKLVLWKSLQKEFSWQNLNAVLFWKKKTAYISFLHFLLAF